MKESIEKVKGQMTVTTVTFDDKLTKAKEEAPKDGDPEKEEGEDEQP